MTDEEKVKWFDSALKFELDGKIQMVMKSRTDGAGAWAIINYADDTVLNSNMEWEPELSVENRDESFLIRTRFPFESASAQWEQYKMFAMA